ncbi:MAG: hypothetical protein WC718_19455 [Phycisphaerales bacterium]|jgi:hypothetical protein
MAKKRKLQNYPTSFERITRAALTRMETATVGGGPLVVIPCGTKGIAINLQMQLRQYWNSLAEIGASGFEVTVAGVEDLVLRASVLAARYTPDRLGVEVIHRNQTVTGLALTRALDAMDQTLDAMDAADPAREKVTTGGTPPAIAAAITLPEELLDPTTAAILAGFPRRERAGG